MGLGSAVAVGGFAVGVGRFAVAEPGDGAAEALGVPCRIVEPVADPADSGGRGIPDVTIAATTTTTTTTSAAIATTAERTPERRAVCWSVKVS
ncbi:MAG: hypothetical protein ABIZ34_02425 [Candidatus Limnocylindrales bacterium]